MATYECLKNNSFLLNKVAILTRPLWHPLATLINIKKYKNERFEYTIMTKGMGGKLWEKVILKKVK